MKHFFLAKAANKRGEIYIYEDIGEGWFGGLTAKAFAEKIDGLGAVNHLDIYINSYGGEVFAGTAIFNVLKRHSARKVVHVDGIAASIASIIAMAGDEIRIAKNAMMMIHEPWGVALGSAAEMREAADKLDQMRELLVDTYVNRTKGERKKISALMAAETWFTADEAKAAGFADVVVEDAPAQEAMASTLVRSFKNCPEPLKRMGLAAATSMAAMDRRTHRIRAASRAVA